MLRDFFTTLHQFVHIFFTGTRYDSIIAIEVKLIVTIYNLKFFIYSSKVMKLITSGDSPSPDYPTPFSTVSPYGGFFVE